MTDDDDSEFDQGPTDSEIWEAMAEAGDVPGILRLIPKADLGLINYSYVFGLLQLASDVLARKNPELFFDLISTDMLAVMGILEMRGTLYLRQLMDTEDEELNRRRRRSAPTRELDEFLPKLMALQMHFVELKKAIASTKRLSELARQHELSNIAASKASTKKRPDGGPGKNPVKPKRRQRISDKNRKKK
jgi:hypothetical protein